MASVRILHASDLHIAQQPNIVSLADRFTPGTLKDAVSRRMLASSYNPAILTRLTGFVEKQIARNSLDAILLTGDIATTGTQADLKKAYEFVNEPATRDSMLDGLARLGAVRIPLLLLPGNHDRYQRFYKPGGTLFDSVFGSRWNGPVMSFDPLTKPGLKVTVIAADFTLSSEARCRGKLGWLGQGRVEGPILDQLENKTKQLPVADRQCVIWAIHFPPVYPGLSPLLELLDGDILVLRANRCGVRAILSGHTHEAIRYRRPGMNFDVFCAGTASQAFAPEGNHFQIIEITSDGSTNVSIVNEEYTLRRTGEIITGPPDFTRA